MDRQKKLQLIFSIDTQLLCCSMEIQTIDAMDVSQK
jgi:hypothetical protein